jgi:hypothetical protein
VGWAVSLLIDPRVQTRRTGLRAPLLLFTFAALGSIIANPTLVNTVEGHVIKQLSYFGSFLIVLCLIVSVVRTHEQVDAMVKVLVGCGSVVAFFALVQAQTGYNVFDHLTSFLPFLREGYVPESPLRGGRLRTYASAQHAIELGAILVMLVPLAGYLALRTAKKRCAFLGALLLMGALATLSRTAMLMLVVIALTFLILRPKQTRRLSGPEYLQLCYRASAYRGSMAARVAEQENEEQETGPKTEEREVTWVDGSREALEHHPEFARAISWGTGG